MPNLYLLDVGHGNSSVLVDTKGTVVVDAGPKTGLLDFLTSHEIHEIDVLLLSHADRDHIGGAMALLLSDEIKIKSVYLNSDSTKSSNSWDDLLWALTNSHNRDELVFEPSLTTHLNGKLNQGSINVEILAPNQYIAAKSPGSEDHKGRKLTTNSISAVIRLSLEEKPVVLLPGDIDQVGLENLFEDQPEMKAWLLVFPHHGGRSGTRDVKEFTNILCGKVQPQIVVFSVGENPRNFPNKDVVNCVERALDGVCMLTTCSSEVFIDFINESDSKLHKDRVGNIALDLGGFPPEIRFGL